MDSDAFEGKSPEQIFRLFAPEFASVPDEVISGYLELAALFVCRREFGKNYAVALVLMAAHIMASPGGYAQDDSTSSGKVLSRREGDLAITYGDISGTNSGYMGGTTYGELLQILRKKSGGGFALMTRGITGGCGCL